MKNLTRMDVLGARKIIWKIIRGNKEVIKGSESDSEGFRELYKRRGLRVNPDKNDVMVL